MKATEPIVGCVRVYSEWFVCVFLVHFCNGFAMALGPGTSTLTPTMLTPPRVPARSQTVRRQFDARAARFARHDALVRVVEQRLIERLDVIRVQPQSVVDMGCGRGRSAHEMRKRYPNARWVGIDASLPMLQAQHSGWRRFWPRMWWGRGDARICADALSVPLRNNCVDLVLSNLMLHWHPQPHLVFPEWLRLLRRDGLLLFSCFGPDTLQELRAACTQALPHACPMPFVDMHDFGDMMVAAGFALPVMDVERLTLTYPSARALIAEARALGGNPRDDRFGGLPGGAMARRLIDALEAQRDDQGRLSLTFEIAYGHASKPERPAFRQSDHAVSLDELRASLPSHRC